VGVEQEVYRHGKLVAAQIGHALPARCVTCNRPAQALFFKELSYLPWYLWPRETLFTVIHFWSRGRFSRPFEMYRTEIEIPLCATHDAKRSRSSWLLYVLMISAFLTFFAGGYFSENIMGFVYTAGGLFLATLLVFLFQYKPFRLRKIDQRFVWLSRISPEYLATLPELEI